MAFTPEQDFVMKNIKVRDVHFVRFWFTDVLGSLKSFAVIPNELRDAFSDGIGFDGSAIVGFSRAVESDMLAFPDPETFQILPWRPESNAVARMFCDIRRPDGTRFEGDSRQVLARTVQRAQDMGYVFNVGPELEFFYFKNDTEPEPLDRGSYFSLTHDSAADLRRDTVLTLEKMGIPVEYSHHEAGPSQHEVDLRYADAMSMADSVMTYKQVVKEIASQHGVYASFMPKPLSDQPGNGMHIHQSLFDMDGNNMFYDPDDPSGYRLSKLCKQYIAGLLKYAPEYTLLTNQTVNSYKRFVPGFNAPFCLAWARANRSALIRVAGCRSEKEEDHRLELRSPDPAANPYLAFSGILAAGLRGIEEELELPEPLEDEDLTMHSRQELRARGIGVLPETLGEAVEAFAESELMRDVLGSHIHDFLVENKRREWNDYLRHVSSWEREQYLAVL